MLQVTIEMYCSDSRLDVTADKIYKITQQLFTVSHHSSVTASYEDEFFFWQYTPEKSTIFQNISNLGPGTIDRKKILGVIFE